MPTLTFDAAGSPAMIAGWYDKVLTGRLVSADLQGAHNTIIPTMGSLQGGILSSNELPAINLPLQ